MSPDNDTIAFFDGQELAKRLIDIANMLSKASIEPDEIKPTLVESDAKNREQTT